MVRMMSGLPVADRYVVDGAVNGVAWTRLSWGRQVRKIQTGRIQTLSWVSLRWR